MVYFPQNRKAPEINEFTKRCWGFFIFFFLPHLHGGIFVRSDTVCSFVPAVITATGTDFRVVVFPTITTRHARNQYCFRVCRFKVCLFFDSTSLSTSEINFIQHQRVQKPHADAPSSARIKSQITRITGGGGSQHPGDPAAPLPGAKPDFL